MVADLPESERPDLRFYNCYLPSHAGLEIVSGIGYLAYPFDGPQEKQSLNGRIEMRMEQIATRCGEIEIISDLKFVTLFREDLPQECKFHLCGTGIELKNGRVVQ